MKFCIHCGEKIEDEARFCTACGSELNAPGRGEDDFFEHLGTGGGKSSGRGGRSGDSYDSERTLGGYNPERTVVLRSVAERAATLLLIDSRKEPVMIRLSGGATIGRDWPGADTDIVIQSEITGRNHGEFFYDEVEDAYYYRDHNSVNGTFINGEKIKATDETGSEPVRLYDGYVLRIDRADLAEPHPEAVVMIFSRSFRPDEKWMTFDTEPNDEIYIGRGKDNDIVLDDFMASREHAKIIKSPGENSIYDLKSRNGIILNNAAINEGNLLFPNDVIKIANTTLIYLKDKIIYNNPGDRAGCLSVNVIEKCAGRKPLIRDISFEADNKDFVLILGSSGAGKTTLIKAILGEGDSKGHVILDGQSLKENFDSMKMQIGLVPQFLTLRKNDKVMNTLMDIADMQLPDFSKKEKRARVEQVLRDVGVGEHSNKYIDNLSGGQQKRVSVAAQLVGYRKVFICDEPDSGLDAAARRQQIEMLKDIADTGKIVMIISHEPDDGNIGGRFLFTKVLVLAKSSKDDCGHLAFFGDPEDALSFFAVSKLQDIMLKINPTHEGGEGKGDYYINKFTEGKMFR